MKLLKLIVPVTDGITGVEGMFTHVHVHNETIVEYVFQPKSLDTKGNPATPSLVVASRFKDAESEDVDVPLEVIGSKVEDIATGYKGKVVYLVYHMNGCLHARVKPPGLNSEGELFSSNEFDIRRLKGPKIKKMSEKEIKADQVKTPSPAKGISKNV